MTQISYEHDRPVGIRGGVVQYKVVGNEVGDDRIGTPSGQSRVDREPELTGTNVFTCLVREQAARRSVHQQDTRADQRSVPRKGATNAGNGRRTRTDVVTAHEPLRGADMAVVVLCEHDERPDGLARKPSGRSSRAHARCRTGRQPAVEPSRSEAPDP